MIGGNAYKAAGWNYYNQRQFRMPRRSSPDNDIKYDRMELIALSRDMVRNNNLARAALSTTVDFQAGTGLTPVCDDNMLAVWNDWAESPSVCGALTWDDIYRNVIGAQFTDGEVLINLPMSGTGSVKRRIQLIESDRIVDKQPSRDGVIYSRNGMEVGYWVARVVNGRYSGCDDADRFDRYKNGVLATTLARRPDVLRPGQSHQVPLMSSSIQVVKDIDDLSDAIIERARTLSLIAAFIETDQPGNIPGASGAIDADGTLREHFSQTGQPVIVGDIEAGSMTTLPFGSKVTTMTPSGSLDVTEMMTFFIRQFGATLGFPLELLLKDFSKTNFASGRLSYDFAYRARDRWNLGNVNSWVNTVFRMVMLEARGTDSRISNYSDAELKAQFNAMRWVGGYNVDVDQKKTADAQSIKIENGTTTQEFELKKEGMEYKDIVESRARMRTVEQDVAKQYGLDPDDLTSIIDRMSGVTLDETGDEDEE